MTVSSEFPSASASTPVPLDAAESPDSRSLSRALGATRLLFLSLGVLAGTWGAHIPSVKARYALSDGMLSIVLLAAAFGAVASLFLAGRVIGWLGARGAALLAALAMSVLLGTVLAHGSLATLLPAVFVLGAAMSLFDVSINTEGAALEALSGRPVMSNLHGMFSVGGMLGAGFAAWMLGAGIAPRWQLAGMCCAIALVGVLASRGMLETHAHGDDGEQASFAWPRGLLLVLGLLIFCGMTAEGVMYDWCVLYLKQDLGLPQARAALGYATFSGAMALTRFAGDALRARFAERTLLRAGGLIAAIAMAVVLLAANPWVALVGFALVGAGLAPMAPILFNAATRVPGVSRAAAIAAVTSIGYGGFMIGPPLIGSLATASSLGAALSVLVFAAALLALGARYVPDKAG